jgi:hypothetical protein
MHAGGEHGTNSCLLYDPCDRGGVRGDDELVDGSERPNPFRDPDDERHSAQRLQRLLREPRRTQTCGYDAKDGHVPS